MHDYEHLRLVKATDSGIYKLILDRGKVNAMSAAVLLELVKAFRNISNDDEIRAVLLCSEKKVFSGGLDLNEMMGLKPQDAPRHVKRIGDGLGSPLICSKPVAVCITGHAIAGGFMLAAACDYVAMKDDKKIKMGATEMVLGMPFPRPIFEILRHNITSKRGFRRVVLLGDIITTREAFDMGLGDSLSDDPEKDAMKWLEKTAKFNPKVFANTKRQLHATFFTIIGETDLSLSGQAPRVIQDQQAAYMLGKPKAKL